MLKKMFDYGLTTKCAGLDPQVIDLIDSLQKAKAMKLNVYAIYSESKKHGFVF
jgi:hypothetical protein